MPRLPALRVQNLGASLKILHTDNTDFSRDKRFTYLTEDVSAAGTTIRVQSVAGFESLTTSSGQIVCNGDIGKEKSEILRTSQTSGEYPSTATRTVFLRDSLLFDHPQETKVSIIDWNRVEFQQAVTVTGTKITLAAYPFPIQPDLTETPYRDTNESANRLSGALISAYYFTRFNDSINSRNSDWSDGVWSSEYEDNTVFALKKRTLDSLNEQVDGNLITHEFLDKELWQARREYHQSPGKRPFRRKFNIDIGNALTGSFRIDLPTDVEKPYTSENVYGVRIGTEQNMTYHDKKAHDEYYRGVAHSTLEHAYVLNTSTSIWLANGRDFSDSATINVEGTKIGLTRIAGLTGDSYYNTFRIYDHGDWAASAGSDAWENVSFGLPDKFTVFADPSGSAHIYFNRPIDTAYIQQNISADYYRTLLPKDSDADEFDEPSPDIYVPRLRFSIKKRKAQGNLPLTDPDYIEWLNKKDEALKQEYIASDIRLYPSVPDLPE